MAYYTSAEASTRKEGEKNNQINITICGFSCICAENVHRSASQTDIFQAAIAGAGHAFWSSVASSFLTCDTYSTCYVLFLSLFHVILHSKNP